jgi:putative oxidoreductase
MKKYLSLLLRIVATIILLQTLYFKFTAHPESVELFTKLGVEPWGRIVTGIIELLAGIFLIIPSTKIYGALLGVGLMCGAIFSHLLVIGIESKGDGGQLFLLAILVLVCCILVLILNKSECISFYTRYFKKLSN